MRSMMNAREDTAQALSGVSRAIVIDVR
jgi:hypothetical protein